MEPTKIGVKFVPCFFATRNMEQPTLSPEEIEVKSCAQNNDIKYSRYDQKICKVTVERSR